MATQRSSGGNFIVSLLLFIVTAGIAVLLFLVSAVVWLSVVMDSVIFSTLILGGFFAALAAAIYFLFMRKSFLRIREQAETIYEMAQIVKSVYDWITEKFHWVGTLWNLFREKPE